MTNYPQRFYQPPPGATQLLLIRHGQSAPYEPAKPFPLVDGHGDPPLTELGHHQAALLGRRLAPLGISALYVSTLTRTHQTAAPLAAATGLKPTVEPDLREIYLGEGEGGRFRQMMAEQHPAAVAVLETGEWGHVSGAESTAELTNRTMGVVDRVARAHPDELVAVVCHGGVIAAALAACFNTTARVFSGARHTSVSHLVATPNSADSLILDWNLRAFNDGSHAGLLTRDYTTEEPS